MLALVPLHKRLVRFVDFLLQVGQVASGDLLPAHLGRGLERDDAGLLVLQVSVAQLIGGEVGSVRTTHLD